MTVIREYTAADRQEWTRLRRQLWPDDRDEDARAEEEIILANPDRRAVFVVDVGDRLIGFIEVSLRYWADGFVTSPVGYVEGWFVEAAHRRRGIGRRLIARAEDWARAKGCTEMGSDALIDNQLSHKAHRALGYREFERLVLFRKRLDP